MGLGPYPEISLASARDKALTLRRLLLEGKDPLEERRKEEARRNKIEGIAFKQVVEKYLFSKKAQWRGEENGTTYKKLKGQLKLHAYPTIGKRPIASIDKNDILKILEPLIEKKAWKNGIRVKKIP